MNAEYVRILPGATAWMKERGFWLRGWPDSIDGMLMTIVGDYSYLPGDSAHFWCENESVRDCGVHPQFVSHDTGATAWMNSLRNYDPEAPENADKEASRARMMRAMSQDEIERTQRANAHLMLNAYAPPPNPDP